MTVVDPDDVTFVPDRMFKLSSRDGIEPSQAAQVVRNFCDCPECGERLTDVDVKDASYVDRDVLWTDERDGGHEYVDEMGERRVTRPTAVDRASAHECSTCGTRLRIMVEEKALGTLSAQQAPEDTDGCSLHFIPYEHGFVVVNTAQVFISPV